MNDAERRRQELLEQLCIMIEGRYLQYTQDMQMHIITCMESHKRI